MIIIEKALVIREPWIDLILSGQKSWEMRGQRPSFRGWLGLIRKGSGRVSCIARLVDVGHPLTDDEMVASFDMHRIPETMIRSGEVAKWTTPWKLADIRVLRQPVPYSHPNGAITLFSLDPKVSATIVAQLGDLAPDTAPEAPGQPPLTEPAPKPSARAVPAVQSIKAVPTPTLAAVPGALLGEVEVTDGNLKHNHFYLRSFLHHLPEDLLAAVISPLRSWQALRQMACRPRRLTSAPVIAFSAIGPGPVNSSPTLMRNPAILCVCINSRPTVTKSP